MSETGKGTGETLDYAVLPNSICPALIAASTSGICFLGFLNEDHCAAAVSGAIGHATGCREEWARALLARRFPGTRLRKARGSAADLLERAATAIENPADSLDLPLDLRGTSFQRRVWDALRAIRPGHTCSYGELAAAIGRPKAARAVGGANGANAIAVLIPCHRVIAADGSLGGYAYGTEIKAELLRREKLLAGTNPAARPRSAPSLAIAPAPALSGRG